MHTFLSFSLGLALSLALVVVAALAAAYWYCIRMPGASFRGEPPALTATETRLKSGLRRHATMLAEEIGERHAAAPERLREAAEYIEAELRALGYTVTEQSFDDDRYRNLAVEIQGRTRPEEIIVVGAHYDTVLLTPGADDNASGVAGLLELARLFWEGARVPERSVRFIAFANEEAPFFGGDSMGSMVSARASRRAGERIVAMFSLEMIGYYSAAPGSQRYPRLIRRFYPDTGDFIAFVGDLRSGAMLRQAVGYFRAAAGIGSVGLIAPASLVPDIQRSDNLAYWRNGYPAIMVTDTANFRNDRYHTAADTAASLDYDNMARVVGGLAVMLRRLAAPPE